MRACASRSSGCCTSPTTSCSARPSSTTRASVPLRAFAADFGQPEIDELARLEATTRHDVKAVEYLVRAKLAELGLTQIAELTHFACTSEDINNLAYALTVQAAVRDVWMPKLRAVIDALAARADHTPRRPDARAHPRPARHPDHRRQGVRGVRAPAGAHRRAHRPPSRSSASSAARPARSARTSPPTRPRTGPRSRRSS